MSLAWPLSSARRQLLLAGLGTLAWPQKVPAAKRQPLQFPRDLGSHPDHAIEWWYITGRLLAAEREFGFQLTFFRSRVPETQAMRSAFAAKQLIFAHAALTDVAGQRLLHDQRIARSSGVAQVDLASASTLDTDVQIGDWQLQRRPDGYRARAQGEQFGFDLALQETQPLLLQGDQGWSRKGPQAQQASWYYSLPQLQVSGELRHAGQTLRVQGRAWLDHEWSQSLLAPPAVGWDWIGMNLLDGSALTAFRLRTATGATVWAGGSWRPPGQAQARIFAPEELEFVPQRSWKSPASGATYPVQWQLHIRSGAAGRDAAMHADYRIEAVLDNQELDSRASTGAIYWEGLSHLRDDQGRLVGHGYLEMTGYASPLRL